MDSRQLADADKPTPARVLVVDDHDDTTELFRVLLERRGLAVSVARSVATALEASRAQPIDALVADITLPDGDGCDLLAELRRARRLPAIALTGLDGEDDVQRCRAAGFDAHFAKPADFQSVVDALRRLLDGTAETGQS